MDGPLHCLHLTEEILQLLTVVAWRRADGDERPRKAPPGAEGEGERGQPPLQQRAEPGAD